MTTIADRRTVVLAVIAAAIDLNGYPPTIREIAAWMGRPVMTTHRDIAALTADGYLDRDPNTTRGIRLTSSAADRIPVANATPRTAPRKATP